MVAIVSYQHTEEEEEEEEEEKKPENVRLHQKRLGSFRAFVEFPSNAVTELPGNCFLVLYCNVRWPRHSVQSERKRGSQL